MRPSTLSRGEPIPSDSSRTERRSSAADSESHARRRERACERRGKIDPHYSDSALNFRSVTEKGEAVCPKCRGVPGGAAPSFSAHILFRINMTTSKRNKMVSYGNVADVSSCRVVNQQASNLAVSEEMLHSM